MSLENPILTKSGEERYIIRQPDRVIEHGKMSGPISFGIHTMERKHAVEEIRSHTNELLKLLKRTQDLANANNVKQVLELITRRAVEIVNGTFPRIARLERTQLVGRRARSTRVPAHDLRLNNSMPITDLPLCQHVFGEHERVVLNSSNPSIGSADRMALLLDSTSAHCLVPHANGDKTQSSRCSISPPTLGAAGFQEREPFTTKKTAMARSIGAEAATPIGRVLLHDKNKQDAQRLAALHSINVSINANENLGTTLNILLDHAVHLLNVSAADILLFNPHTKTLEYSTGIGYHSRAIETSQLRLGEGYAGKAALERRTITVPDLKASDKSHARRKLLAGEEFVTYFGVPLIAKGNVIGILEVFNRSRLTPSPDWMWFMEALASQAAIAIDSATLSVDLQRSSVELFLAYDSTIEGWSRAMDLRDHETEGHTLRVTDLTLQLAQALHLGDDEILQVRRGALLHDIGKLGIPDRILHKPGLLSDEEWDIMRMHPQYAFDLLSPIAHLKTALDIPYCHHEKWDGTGYQRGLKGEQIPMAARLFAVADVWDALCSDRPYRKAWSKEMALEHIKSSAGTHFDPNAVKLFLMVLEKGPFAEKSSEIAN